MKKQILKRYFDEKEWEEVAWEQEEQQLARFYLDVELILADLLKGETIYTDVAEYRASPAPPGRKERERCVRNATMNCSSGSDRERPGRLRV
jgi:hypothetical protein